MGVENKKIFVAGHNGMVGSAIIRKLNSIGNCNIITAERKDLDLTNQLSVNLFFRENPIDVVILAAAKVGGIHANNTNPADFIYDNLMIEANIIFASYQMESETFFSWAHLAYTQRILNNQCQRNPFFLDF